MAAGPARRSATVLLVSALLPLAGCAGLDQATSAYLEREAAYVEAGEVPYTPPPTVGKLGRCARPAEDPDRDGDGLTDAEESWWTTDPTNPDTDGDGLLDGIEVRFRESYPFRELNPGADSDGDGLPDGAEACFVGTSPSAASTDGDRYLDGTEYFGTTFQGTVSNNEGHHTGSLPSYIAADPFEPAAPHIVARVSAPRLEIRASEEVRKSISGLTEFERTRSTHVGVSFMAWTQTVASASAGTTGVKASVSSEAGVRTEFTTSWSMGTNFLSRTSDEWATAENVDYGKDAFVRANLLIENVGNDIVRTPLSQLTINFFLGIDEDAFATWTPGLVRDDTGERGGFLAVTENLRPNDPPVELANVEIPLTLAQFKRYAAGAPLTAVIGEISWGEDERILENVRGSSIAIDIDRGNGKLARKYVAGRDPYVVAQDDGRTLARVVEGAGLSLSLAKGASGSYVASVEGVQGADPAAAEGEAFWSLVRIRGKAVEIPTDLEGMTLRAGERIILRHGVDADGDLLIDALEAIFGTNPNAADSDADGRDDLTEILEGTQPVPPPTLDDRLAAGPQVDEVVLRTVVNGTGRCTVWAYDSGTALWGAHGSYACTLGGTLGRVVAADRVHLVERDVSVHHDCVIRDALNGTLVENMSVACPPTPGGFGGLAAGDFLTERVPGRDGVRWDPDEIVVAGNDGRCTPYRLNATGFGWTAMSPFECRSGQYKPIGAIDSDGDGRDALVVFDASDLYCYLFDVARTGARFEDRLASKPDCAFPEEEARIVGDLTNDPGEEILLIDRPCQNRERNGQRGGFDNYGGTLSRCASGENNCFLISIPPSGSPKLDWVGCPRQPGEVVSMVMGNFRPHEAGIEVFVAYADECIVYSVTEKHVWVRPSPIPGCSGQVIGAGDIIRS